MRDGTTADPGDHRKAGVPWGLLGMALLVLGVEVSIARHDGFTTLASAEHRFAYRAAREARRYEVLCFGDSQAKDGVVPRVVEARLGKRTLNLAVPGAPAPASYYLLRRALASGARPSALLVDYHAWLMEIDPRHRAVTYADICDLRECVELAWTARDAAFLGTMTAASLLPSVKAREPIRADVVAALSGGPADRLRRTIPQSRRNWNVNRGAQVMPRIPDVVKIPEFWDESASYPKHWRCLPTNAAYIRKFFRLAAEDRIPVFFLVPPRHPRVQANRERLGLDALYTRFLRRVTAGDPNVTVIDARRSGYDPSVFIDSSHFDRQGACDFSDDVASVVAERLAPGGRGRPSWVDLPRHRIRPEPAAIEDLAQSEVALKATPAVPRR